MQNPPKIFYVDPVGGHLGMHYYDLELCQSLSKHNEIFFLTCDETKPYCTRVNYTVKFPFEKIYGSRNKILRGLHYLKGLLRIQQLALKEKPMLCHFHFFHFPMIDYLALWFLHLKGMKIVITAHDVVPFDVHSMDSYWLGKIYRLAETVVIHTENSKKTLLEKFRVSEKRAEVIPQGPYFNFSKKMNADSAKASLGINKDSPTVLFFGQIKKVKGLQHLISAFRLVLDQITTSTLVIAGPLWKDSFEKYDSLIQKLRLRESVKTRVEYIPDDEVSKYLSAADVISLPYTEIYQSAVLYMAHSFAVPVVASAIGGLAEVIKHNETGLLVPPGDERALADSIIEILRNPKKAKTLGENGKKHVERNYSWDSIASALSALYNRIQASPSK